MSFKAKGRDVIEDIEGGEGYHLSMSTLREEAAPYTALFRAEKDDIGSENAFFWNVNIE